MAIICWYNMFNFIHIVKLHNILVLLIYDNIGYVYDETTVRCKPKRFARGCSTMLKSLRRAVGFKFFTFQNNKP